MVMVNMIAPLIFIGRREARIVIAVFLAQGAFMLLLFWIQGFTRLLGLAHLGWIGLIYYLWMVVDWKSGERSSWGLWLRALVAMDAISLSIDIVDVIRFSLER